MADSKKDKIKYGILKFIDVSGFKVLDPPVRLAFGEEPQKQVRDIARFMLLPSLFVGLCILTWHIAGPTHKTKSGEVPTPGKILSAYSDNKRFDERENEKERDFSLTGKERLAEIELVKSQLATFEKESAALEVKAKETAIAVQNEIDAKLAPINGRIDTLKAQSKEQKADRKEKMTLLAGSILAGTASQEELLALIEEDRSAAEAERDELKTLKDQLDDIRSNPPKKLKESQLASNRVADEVQHYRKRLDYLTTGNREVKKDELLAKIETDQGELIAATTPADVIKEAKAIVSNRERAAKTDEQDYPRTATIFWQTKRSLATVFVGFVIAAAVAIPLGIMCGLNKVVMACLTPIISIFRPVSPVVWLLIFQIVVGAFFPDPEKHPLFATLNTDHWFGWIPNPLAFLQTNPAMIFSACTVAMCALWPALVNTALGVSAIDKDHLNVARVLKLGFWSRLFKIVIPSSLPLVFAGLRISLGVGWMVLIAAEALSSSDGLGKFVWDEYQNGSSQSFANIILACFIVGIIGFFLDRIMIVLQRLVSFDDGSATA
ncbi:MAG: ABC transporter permease subunit [Verrucomicrobiaceae bacterium]